SRPPTSAQLATRACFTESSPEPATWVTPSTITNLDTGPSGKFPGPLGGGRSLEPVWQKPDRTDGVGWRRACYHTAAREARPPSDNSRRRDRGGGGCGLSRDRPGARLP